MDTVLFSDSKVVASYRYVKENRVRKLSSLHLGYDNFVSCLESLWRQHKWKSKQIFQNQVICYLFVKNTRKKITEKDIAEIIDKNVPMPNVSILQLSKPQFHIDLKFYELKASFNLSGYTTKFTSLGDHVDNLALFEKARVICRSLIENIEKSAVKRVILIEFELIEDCDEQLWLGNIINCKVISMDKLESIIETDFMKEYSKYEKEVCYFRGEMRRQTTDALASTPFKINSPRRESHKTLANSETAKFKRFNTNHFTENNTERDLEIPKNELSKNFLELVCKTNLKNKFSKEEYKTEQSRICNLIENGDSKGSNEDKAISDAEKFQKKTRKKMKIKPKIKTQRENVISLPQSPIQSEKSAKLPIEIKPFNQLQYNKCSLNKKINRFSRLEPILSPRFKTYLHFADQTSNFSSGISRLESPKLY